jgi:hypothetical protein
VHHGGSLAQTSGARDEAGPTGRCAPSRSEQWMEVPGLYWQFEPCRRSKWHHLLPREVLRPLHIW